MEIIIKIIITTTTTITWEETLISIITNKITYLYLSIKLFFKILYFFSLEMDKITLINKEEDFQEIKVSLKTTLIS